jgi:kynurenine formamidase
MTRYYDLTQPLWEYSPRTVGQPQTKFYVLRDLVSDGVLSRAIDTSLHAGTHIDAPCHFPGSLVTLDQIPLSTLCGSGVVLDLARDVWGVITGDDLENARPRIEPGDRVVMNTGWHRFYDTDPEMYMLKPPGCDKSAVDWFVERRVSWVGSDAPSPDHTFGLTRRKQPRRPDVYTDDVMASIDRDRFPLQYAHKTLLKSDIPMVEYLGGQIDEVTGRRLTLMALPPKLKMAEAAQCRVIAVTED